VVPKVLDKTKGADDDEKIGIEIVQRSSRADPDDRPERERRGRDHRREVKRRRSSTTLTPRPTSTEPHWQESSTRPGHPHGATNAVIAGLLLTTECVVEEKEKTPPMPGGGVGRMY
jgi:hypothetical protein